MFQTFHIPISWKELFKRTVTELTSATASGSPPSSRITSSWAWFRQSHSCSGLPAICHLTPFSVVTSFRSHDDFEDCRVDVN